MPVRLDSQRAAQEARRLLASCYLCGNPLPARGPGWRKGLRAEHVVPKSILDLVVPRPTNYWPLILDVHEKCDADFKAPRDQMVKITAAAMGGLAVEWSKEDAGLVRNRFGVGVEWVGGWDPVSVLKGDGDELLYGAYLWARGCHAALYGAALPWPCGQWTRCPAPSFMADSPDPHADMRDDRVLANATLGGVAEAIRRGGADTVSLLGGAIEYNCVWVHFPHLDERDEPWMCMWTLDIPGAQHWSRDTRGRDVPWHGMYRLATKPEAASILAATA